MKYFILHSIFKRVHGQHIDTAELVTFFQKNYRGENFVIKYWSFLRKHTCFNKYNDRKIIWLLCHHQMCLFQILCISSLCICDITLICWISEGNMFINPVINIERTTTVMKIWYGKYFMIPYQLKTWFWFVSHILIDIEQVRSCWTTACGWTRKYNWITK